MVPSIVLGVNSFAFDIELMICSHGNSIVDGVIIWAFVKRVVSATVVLRKVSDALEKPSRN